MVMVAMDREDAKVRLQGSLDEVARAAGVCRGAAAALGSPQALDVVNALAGIHERDLAELRRLGAGLGLDEAQPEVDDDVLDPLRVPDPGAGDGAILELVRAAEERVAQAYEHVRDDPALPEECRALAAAGLEELARRRERLEGAMRLAV
jgi:hypothetical protein